MMVEGTAGLESMLSPQQAGAFFAGRDTDERHAHEQEACLRPCDIAMARVYKWQQFARFSTP